MAYLLDADVFIQAKNLHYGFEFCPAFWDWLIAANTARNVFSIEKVADELKAGSDELADWAGRRAPGFFLEPDAAIAPALTSVSAWATGQRYQPAAVSTPSCSWLTTTWWHMRWLTARPWSHTRFRRPQPSESRFRTRASDSESSA